MCVRERKVPPVKTYMINQPTPGQSLGRRVYQCRTYGQALGQDLQQAFAVVRGADVGEWASTRGLRGLLALCMAVLHVGKDAPDGAPRATPCLMVQDLDSRQNGQNIR